MHPRRGPATPGVPVYTDAGATARDHAGLRVVSAHTRLRRARKRDSARQGVGGVSRGRSVQALWGVSSATASAALAARVQRRKNPSRKPVMYLVRDTRT